MTVVPASNVGVASDGLKLAETVAVFITVVMPNVGQASNGTTITVFVSVTVMYEVMSGDGVPGMNVGVTVATLTG